MFINCLLFLLFLHISLSLYIKLSLNINFDFIVLLIINFLNFLTFLNLRFNLINFNYILYMLLFPKALFHIRYKLFILSSDFLHLFIHAQFYKHFEFSCVPLDKVISFVLNFNVINTFVINIKHPILLRLRHFPELKWIYFLDVGKHLFH